ncbi:MAG TPA: ATP-binding protein [Opitutus sp.]|nr:ATP-binding protein [Opitutus sp.]
MKRIAVFGTESTGKTTLAERLAKHFGVEWVPEYAREFWDKNGGVIGLEDMAPIAREQWRREDEAVKRAEKKCHVIRDTSGGARALVICDTEALTTMLWSDLLYGTCPEEVRRGAEKRCRNYALYLLCDIDLPFAPDPQRCFPDPDDRAKAARVWRGALERRGLPFVEIRGGGVERERAAVAAIGALLTRGH